MTTKAEEIISKAVESYLGRPRNPSGISDDDFDRRVDHLQRMRTAALLIKNSLQQIQAFDEVDTLICGAEGIQTAIQTLEGLDRKANRLRLDGDYYPHVNKIAAEYRQKNFEEQLTVEFAKATASAAARDRMNEISRTAAKQQHARWDLEDRKQFLNDMLFVALGIVGSLGLGTYIFLSHC